VATRDGDDTGAEQTDWGSWRKGEKKGVSSPTTDGCEIRWYKLRRQQLKLAVKCDWGVKQGWG